jgi:hypothetical protein
MIALLTSAALVLYIVIPGALYRFIYSLFVPLKAFQRSKTEEVTFAASACLLPGALAMVLFVVLSGIRPLLHVSCSVVPCKVDYEAFIAAAYDEKCFSCGQPSFWEAFARVFWSQVWVLGFFYTFVAVKASLYGHHSKNIHRFFGSEKWRPEWFAKHFLMPNVSEWYFLLTGAMFPSGNRRVMVDILTAEDHLYRGRVDPGGYFLDKDGELSGILLKEASRFDRRRHLKDQEAGKDSPLEQYWTPIPGANWYIPHSKILNLNIRYERVFSRQELKALIENLLRGLNIEGRVDQV